LGTLGSHESDSKYPNEHKFPASISRRKLILLSPVSGTTTQELEQAIYMANYNKITPFLGWILITGT